MRRDICMRAALVLGLSWGLLLAGPTPDVSAQVQVEVDPALYEVVFPDATRFGPRQGTPPVVRAYVNDPTTGEEVLAGYVFLTTDLPPIEKGYNSIITSLVGMDLRGRITGVRVIDYRAESLRSSRGDFLEGFFQRQFAGKRMTDRFVVRRDVETVSGATITAGATARGIRSAARRVAGAYIFTERGNLTDEEIQRLTWPELDLRGIADKLIGEMNGQLRLQLTLVPIRDEAMGRALMGNSWDRAVRRAGTRFSERKPWMIGVDGSMTVYLRPTSIYILRGQDTLRFTQRDIQLTGQPRDGKVDGQFRNLGLILVDSTLDARQNFTWQLDFGSGIPLWSVEHVGEPRVATAPPAPRPTTEGEAGVDIDANAAEAGEEPTGTSQTVDVSAAASDSATGVIAAVPAEPAAPLIDPAFIDFADVESESVLQRTLESTSWTRVAVVVALLALASAAFFAKLVWLRWVSLGLTLVVLGFAGGGFLSVSHITAGIKAGPSVFLQDIPLLLLVAFTVATTLLWGRVFCGYLCPFGALQDFMEHIVPKKLRRKFPHPVHESGLFLKYGVLGVILVPAVAGSNVSIFQYFEPFGTVFFWSRSMVLWAIAGTILIASAIIPRFYCRYFCPLGASLALASLISPFRIKRVPHCTLCVVCEHSCPTGAILREKIDFHECVRCNVCEVRLREAAGVCGHDLDRVSQLIQLKRGLHHKHQPVPIPEPAGGD